MELHKIIEGMGRGLWLKDIDKLLAFTQNFQATKKDLNLIFENVKKYANKKQKGKTLNWLVLGLTVNQNKILNRIIHDGLFRTTNYNYNAKFAYEIHNEIKSNHAALFLNEKNRTYFNSKTIFLSPYKQISLLFNEIICDLKKYKKTIFKDLLIIADFYFLYDIYPQQKHDPSKLTFFSKEEISEAISFLTFHSLKYCKIPSTLYLESNEKNIIENKYEPLIFKACLLKKYLEWEIDIDAFKFECSKNGNKINLKSRDPLLEKSRKNGWVSTEIQKLNFQGRIHSDLNEAESLEVLCDNLLNKYGDLFIKKRKEPVERFTLEIPYEPNLFEFLKKQTFFKEELTLLITECREMFVSLDDILQYKVRNQLTFHDVLIVKRFFNFLRTLFSKHLKDQMKDNPTIVLRSLIPVFNKERLFEILRIFIPDNKIDDLLGLLSWSYEQNTILDLQYRPIIKIGNSYVIPTNIMCKSNLIRNSLYIIRKRIYDNVEEDPIATLLKEEFRGKNITSETNVKYNSQGFIGDIDALAKLENTIFIFEAKNTILPANPYELRTTYDNLIKASSQLDKIVRAFNNDSFRKYFSEKIGWVISPQTKFCTCIVLGNRVFSGYRINGHPVRSTFELCHFIDEGRVEHQDGNTYYLWESDIFKASDLMNYLMHDHFHKVQFDMYDKIILEYFFKQINFNYYTYEANEDSFISGNKFKEKFRFVKRKDVISSGPVRISQA